MTYYKSCRIVGWIIVDENGNIINRNPSKDELKGLEEEPYKVKRKYLYLYTDKELLDYIRRFVKEYRRIPTARDFDNNYEYPNSSTYQKRFGSWKNALRLVGLDVESMVKNGIVENSDQKARLAEMVIKNHFKQYPIDLAGDNKNSSCDGICPNGKTYDVKSSKLHRGTFWSFKTKNRHKDEIEIYYFLAFNEDWTKIEYGWRVPGEIAEKDGFFVGLNCNYEFNIENMKEYDITDRLKELTRDYTKYVKGDK